MTHELSDRLKRLRNRFKEYRDTGRVFYPHEVEELITGMNTLVELAHDLEEEVSVAQWNAAARDGKAITAAVLSEAKRPGTNLRLMAPERPFSDGRPR